MAKDNIIKFCKTEAKSPEKQDINTEQNLKDIYIGVFFDGTGNNMAYNIKSQKKKLKDYKKNPSDQNENSETSEDKHNNSKQLFHKKVLELSNTSQSFNLVSLDLIEATNRIKQKKTERDENLRVNNSHMKVSEEEISPSNANIGYSNIAILYSLFKDEKEQEKEKPNSKWYHIYIEGSGATDISCLSEKNMNGLGFGLGNTGVTALVSKAVIYVTRFVNSLQSEIDEHTKLHFFVFGFSRGSTCARLFSHLVTREEEEPEPIKREDEFKEFVSDDYFYKSRLAFLNSQASINNGLNGKLQQHLITIEFLGIYDTVASIGFLKQKDGWYDPLRKPYKNKKNYKDNWHYNNVNEYGLYISAPKDSPIPNKLKNCLHIGAMDEYRENFAFTNIGENVPLNAVEIMVPGCHSDVGGGFLSGEEQEIMLDKETRIFENTKNKTLTKINFNCYHQPKSHSAITDTLERVIKSKESGLMSLESLQEVGWISLKDSNRTLFVKEKNGDDGHLLFKRNVTRGYSDFTLKMMIMRCNKKSDCQIFEEPKKYNYSEITDNDVTSFGKYLISYAETADNGNRYWLYPSERLDGELYKKLRLNYLHFTSTSQIGHLKSPVRIIKQHTPSEWLDNPLDKFYNPSQWFNKPSQWINMIPLELNLGNFGNKPNFDESGLLCRITYHGDKKSNNEAGKNIEKGNSNNFQDESKTSEIESIKVEDVHYLYELGALENDVFPEFLPNKFKQNV